MTEAKAAEQVVGVRLLSLLLAGLLWLGVTLERPGELTIQVPVVLEHLPAGLVPTSTPPRALEVTVSGPRILLVGPWLLGGGCALDLSEAQAGASSYRTLNCNFGFDREVKVVRVHPAELRLNFANTAPGGPVKLSP